MPQAVTSTSSTSPQANSRSRPSSARGKSAQRKGSWQYDSALAQVPGSQAGQRLSASFPYASGIDLVRDAVTGQKQTVLAPFVFNGINGRSSAVGDGKRYSGSINGAEVPYFNGRTNLYADANQNGKLDASDPLKGVISQTKTTSKHLDLTGQSGTWSITGSQLSLISSAGQLLFTGTVPPGLF